MYLFWEFFSYILLKHRLPDWFSQGFFIVLLHATRFKIDTTLFTCSNQHKQEPETYVLFPVFFFIYGLTVPEKSWI